MRKPSGFKPSGIKPSGIITLLTDFGLNDPFTGVMKGVIRKINPAAEVIDLAHRIGDYSTERAAFILHSSFKYFPEGTVHVTVVDPGVGSVRKILAAEAGNHFFLAADNGVLKYILHDFPDTRVVSVENPVNFLPEISSTFHGRDIFAPAAARLAEHGDISALGPYCTSCIKGDVPEVKTDGKRIHGTVIYSDNFGNLITNIKNDLTGGSSACILYYRKKYRDIPLRQSYSESAKDGLLLIKGSSSYLEIAVNRGSAEKALGLSINSRFILELK